MSHIETEWTSWGSLGLNTHSLDLCRLLAWFLDEAGMLESCFPTFTSNRNLRSWVFTNAISSKEAQGGEDTGHIQERRQRQKASMATCT